MVAVVDHELGHAAVDGKVLPVDEAGFFRAEKHDRAHDVQGVTNALDSVLQQIAR